VTLFLRLLHSPIDAKAPHLRQAVAWIRGDDTSGQLPERTVFEREPGVFSTIPGSPFAYWVSDRMLALFSELPRLESGNRAARRTNATTDDGRWIRTWWEVSTEAQHWVPSLKAAPIRHSGLTCIS
jgi:hypothetical protein